MLKRVNLIWNSLSSKMAPGAVSARDFVDKLHPDGYPFCSNMPFELEKVKARAAELAASGVYIGTSSWKYEGWRGMVYDESRYVYHGKPWTPKSPRI